MVSNYEKKIRVEIQRLFRLESSDRAGFDAKVKQLHQFLGDPLFVDMLYACIHLEFAPRSARKHYNNILLHWEKLNDALAREVDFRVALLDYFVAIDRRIKNPTIIELKVLRKTQEETEIDELTRLYNFRYFKKALDREVERAIRYKAPLSLVLVDVDDFKFYNDRNGHLAGNKALKKMSLLLQQGVRSVDIVARFGGEEFALLLPETTKEGALVTAERVRQSIAKASFSYGAKQPLRKFSISGGIASLHMDADNTDNLIKKTDLALYKAKAGGKNQLALYITEQREFQRVQSSLTARINSKEYDGQIVSLHNISEGSFAFLAGKAIPEQENIQLGLEFPGCDSRVQYTAMVRRVRKFPSNSKYEMGASIEAINSTGKRAVKKYITSCLQEKHIDN